MMTKVSHHSQRPPSSFPEAAQNRCPKVTGLLLIMKLLLKSCTNNAGQQHAAGTDSAYKRFILKNRQLFFISFLFFYFIYNLHKV